MGSKNFDRGFRSTVPETGSVSRFRKSVNPIYENDLRRSVQDVNTRVDFLEHDDLKDQYKPEALRSSPTASERMDYMLQRRKENSPKRDTPTSDYYFDYNRQWPQSSRLKDEGKFIFFQF